MGSANNSHAVQGVEYATNSTGERLSRCDTFSALTERNVSGERFSVLARKEVILSGGVVGTPQLLLLSGIGPHSHLEKLGIKTFANLSDVGENLADHPLFPNYFKVNATSTILDVFSNQTALNADLQEWMSRHQGPLVDSPGNTLGFMKLPAGFEDPSSGSKSANTELIFVVSSLQFLAFVEPTFTFFRMVLHPLAQYNNHFQGNS